MEVSRDSRSFMKTEYQALVDSSLDWKLRELRGPSVPRAVVDGKNVLVLCSNNYLSLSNHPRLKEAAIEAVKTHGAGSGGVRAISGTMDLHLELEKRFAKFKNAEAALYYQTGFAANAGLIPQLVGEGDLVISDELNHGSIIDGVRLSKAERTVYKHGDVSDLERVLNEVEQKNPAPRRVLIITDGVFSMDGDIAPLPEIAKLAQEHGAMTYVDDCHGDGVLGEGGRGVVSHFHLHGKIDVDMGGFSKALGVVGGTIAGSRDLVNFALNKSRTFLLSGSAPPATVAACIAAIDVLETEPEHVRKLWDNTTYFKKELKALGFDTGKSQTPITPVMLGESAVAKEFSKSLFEEGVFALPIVFPMVARDKARIRTMMNAALTREDLDYALSAFEKIGKKLRVV